MYRNPYYEPYLKTDELEHYGVKGMRWGVRKEDETSSRSSSGSSNRRLFSTESRSAANVSRSLENGQSNYVDRDRLAAAYSVVESLAAKYFRQKQHELNKKAETWHNNSINDLTGEKGDALWNECYERAVKDLKPSQESTILLAAYAALKQYGVENMFDVELSKSNGKYSLRVIHRGTGKSFSDVYSAYIYARKTGGVPTREKNVTGTASVTVHKDKPVSGKASREDYGSSDNTAIKHVLNEATRRKELEKRKSTVDSGDAAITSAFKSLNEKREKNRKSSASKKKRS